MATQLNPVREALRRNSTADAKAGEAKAAALMARHEAILAGNEAAQAFKMRQRQDREEALNLARQKTADAYAKELEKRNTEEHAKAYLQQQQQQQQQQSNDRRK